MENKQNQTRKFQVVIWYKTNLSIEEAAAYSGISRDKLYEMINKIGNRRLIKREVFDEYIKKHTQFKEESL